MKTNYSITRIICLVVFTFTSLAVAQTENQDIKSINLPYGIHQIAREAAPASLTCKGVIVYSSAKQLEESQRQLLKEEGLSLVLYLGNDTWWARRTELSPEQAKNQFAAFKPAAWMKTTPGARRLINGSAGKNVTLLVSFMPDLQRNEINAVLSATGPMLLEKTILYGERAIVTLPAGKAKVLLENENIIAAEPGNRQRRTLNKKAAKLSRTDVARSNFDLQGEGMVVGVWDGGKVYSHKELKDRLIIGKNSTVDEHATHVAGTVAAEGKKKNAKGMAPAASILSYDFNGDIHSQMQNSRNKYDVLLTNNSYGYPNGWEWEGEWVWYGDDYFGRYSSEARAFDKVVENSGVIVVFAAGNDRQDTGPGEGKYFDTILNKYRKDAPRKRDGPYICVGEEASGKNVIAVGALADKGTMAAYSSWGPTLDGRIKPEVTANGNGVLSTVPGNSYDRFSGTSMATPVVTGSLTLVAQYWQEQTGEVIRPDLMRALVAIAARDAGNPGPDYSFGFGILDTENMLEIIEARDGNSNFFFSSLNNGRDSATFKFTVGSGKNLKAVLAWIDPAAAADANPALVNDLNLTAHSPNNKKWYPWTLDFENPKENAVRKTNSVDNIELISVEGAETGVWTFTVNAGKSYLLKSQKFVLIVFQE